MTYPLNNKNKQHKYTTILHILHNNGYDTEILDIIINSTKKQHIQSPNNNQQEQHPSKWATFTYKGKQTKFIAKILKKHNSENSIQNQQYPGATAMAYQPKQQQYKL